MIVDQNHLTCNEPLYWSQRWDIRDSRQEGASGGAPQQQLNEAR